jgi:hypothetical protein
VDELLDVLPVALRLGLALEQDNHPDHVDLLSLDGRERIASPAWEARLQRRRSP